MQELVSKDEDEDDMKRTFAESEGMPSKGNSGLTLEITESSPKDGDR